MGKEEDHFILREYLKYVLEIIELDAKKLGLTYWPLFLVFSKSAPSIEFAEFEMRIEFVNPGTGRLEVTSTQF